jgi:hypothetical protein
MIMPFYKLLDVALRSLPSEYHYSGKVFRGAKWAFPFLEDHDTESFFYPGRRFFWHEPKSTAYDKEVMESDNFCGQAAERQREADEEKKQQEAKLAEALAAAEMTKRKAAAEAAERQRQADEQKKQQEAKLAEALAAAEMTKRKAAAEAAEMQRTADEQKKQQEAKLAQAQKAAEAAAAERDHVLCEWKVAHLPRTRLRISRVPEPRRRRARAADG